VIVDRNLKSLKMEAKMLKITKMVRTVAASPNNALIGRNIQSNYRQENLKQTFGAQNNKSANTSNHSNGNGNNSKTKN